MFFQKTHNLAKKSVDKCNKGLKGKVHKIHDTLREKIQMSLDLDNAFFTVVRIREDNQKN
jgi:hypothetical protein